MKKRIWLLSILLACLAFVLCACGGEKLTATLDQTSVELKVEETVKLRVELSEPGAEFSWSVSDDTVLAIDAGINTAKITALKEGTASVYIMSGKKILAQCDITVTAGVKEKVSVLLPTGKLILKSRGKQATVKALIDESLTGDVVWTCSDPEVLTIESQGPIAVIKSLRTGNVTVTVSCGGESTTFTVIVGIYS